MGLLNLFNSIRKPESELRLLTLGLDKAGKTTILKSLTDEDITTVAPTQGFNVKTVMNSGFKLNVWDIGGNKNVRPYWKRYFPETDGLIYVIDSADVARVEESGQELNQLLEEELLASVPVLVIANKQDVEGALSCKAIVETMTLNNIRDRNWQIFGCSAKTGEGIGPAIEWMIKNATNSQGST